MKNSNFLANILACLFIIFALSCKKDNDSSSLLVGTWNTTNSVLEVTIDGIDYVEYLVNELGYTQEDAEAILTLYQNGGPSQIIFRENGTYIASFVDDDPESGTWRLSEDEKTLTIIPEDDDELIIEIVSLTESSLEVIITNQEMGDVNEDGDDELIIYTQTMNFSR
jgi:hypothetical protein